MLPLQKERLLIFLFWVLLCPVYAAAQTVAPEDILARYEKYPVEKVFLHLDKGEYVVGEPMQFKAWVICRGQLSKISTNLYVELLDVNKKLIIANKTPVTSGVSEGFMVVPAKTSENVYYIRAYTNWMLNFDEQFQFIRPLNIYNSSSDKKLAKAAVSWSVELKPEGGNWLSHTNTKLAVRIKATGDFPDTVHGYLYEGNDSLNKLADIQFYNNEIGSLVFSQLAGKEYHVKVVDGSGTSKIVRVSAPVDTGIALKVNATSKVIDYSLQAKGITDQLKGYKIIAYNKGQLLFNGMIPAARETVEGKIPVDSKTAGVVHIAVFDPNGKLAAQRLCFVDNNPIPGIAPSIAVIARSEQAKGLNRFEINTSDTLNRHTYLAEVTGSDTPLAWPQQNLLAAFYLDDLPRLPFHASRYTDLQDPLQKEALDYLLMSESRGLYDWSWLLSHPVPEVTRFPDNYITYQGRITLDNKPVANEAATVLLKLNDSVNIVRDIKTNAEGAFGINKIFFRDSAKVYFHIHKKTRFDDLYEISFKEVWDTAGYRGSLPATAYQLTAVRDEAANARVQGYVQALSAFDLGGKKEAAMMEVVKVQAVRNLTKELEKELTTPLFSDPSEMILDFINQDQDTGGSLLLDFLNGRLPGVTVNPGEAPVFRGGPIALYMDEMPADIEMINTMPIDNIALVKFLRNSFALGATYGVLSIYTKRGRLLAESQPGRKPKKFNSLAGYLATQRFEAVDYSQPGVDKTIKDTRSVLLWKPGFNNGIQQVDFYNNDHATAPILIFTGLDATGRPFYLRRKF